MDPPHQSNDINMWQSESSLGHRVSSPAIEFLPLNEKQNKHEAAVLRGRAEFEGWPEEKLTAALVNLAEMNKLLSDSAALPPNAQELVDLRRKAKSEGWSEAKLTTALIDFTKNNEPSEAEAVPVNKQIPSTTVVLEEALRWQKRQETTRITRQAENEGWSDEKTLAALRLRNSVHHELKGSVLWALKFGW
ncbi:hypothetical protein N8I77_004965 [Diaporthe amygdali]|uniref:Uncharacterized protein n=1 Tax=Phomopsis amygdali TaxID=1214568 RepID=A0AAD9W7K9_PHOAM|nr:hypothetical protein N8I77_004965 [Diaporthe amygdali]